MSKPFLFTSESVTEGHPDKVCDYVADSILDAYLASDPGARVACEVLAKSGRLILAWSRWCRTWHSAALPSRI